jgi:hypothetical protein
MKTTAHRKKNSKGIFVLLTRRSNFSGLWLKPKGPTEDFRLILSRSKVMTSFLLTFAREFEHHEGPVLNINLVCIQKWFRGVK